MFRSKIKIQLVCFCMQCLAFAFVLWLTQKLSVKYDLIKLIFCGNFHWLGVIKCKMRDYSRLKIIARNKVGDRARDISNPWVVFPRSPYLQNKWLATNPIPDWSIPTPNEFDWFAGQWPINGRPDTRWPSRTWHWIITSLPLESTQATLESRPSTSKQWGW